MFFKIIKFVQTSDFIDGSDIYRIYSTCGNARYHFDWLHFQSLITSVLEKHVKKKLHFDQLLSYWHAVHCVMCTENVEDALDHHPNSFITSWYIMRIVLLSTYLLKKKKGMLLL